MTFRARPVTKRPGRAGWDAGERRNTLINAGFVAAIVVSILILIGYAGWSWYDGHFGAAATVDGQTITKDDVRSRIRIEKFRLDYIEARIRGDLAANHISKEVADQQISQIQQRVDQLESISVERLIDAKVQSKLAGQEGVTVTDADIDAQLAKESTTEEERHVWAIEVEPAKDPATGEAGTKEKAEAKAKAEKALADLKAGKKWEDVAKATSSGGSGENGGDLGYQTKENGYDKKLMEAAFAVEKDKPTDVVEGEDGTFRIGRVTDIVPSSVDSAFSAKLDLAGIKLAEYRDAVRADVLRTHLSDKVVADLSKPAPQRHVEQIVLCAPSSSNQDCPQTQTAPKPDAVSVRHILFSPKDDPSGAGAVPATDPSWAKAKADAQAAYDKLLRDPTKFDVMARTLSDEASAKTSGGKLGWYDPTSPIDKAFADAIFKKGLKPGDLIPPFKSAFGWHVVQFMRPYGDGNKAWLDTIKTQADAGTDFAQLARDQGEGPEAAKGGDIGWIARGQLDETKETTIFETKVGSTSTVLDVPSDGDYLFKVLAEETRSPTPEQISVFKQNGFSNWYAKKKAEANIVRIAGQNPTT